MTRVILVLVLLAFAGSARAEDLTYCKLGSEAARAGNTDLVIDYLTRCLNEGDLTLGNQVVLFNNRGIAYFLKDEHDRALRDFDQAVLLDPTNSSYLLVRGNAHRQMGQYDRAIRDYDQAIQLKPDYAQAYNNKALLLASARDASVRDGEEAVRLAREAIRLDEDEPSFRGTLAAAYADAGQFDDAVAEQDRAIDMLRTAGRDDEVADSQTRLELYRNRQPYRE